MINDLSIETIDEITTPQKTRDMHTNDSHDTHDMQTHTVSLLT